MRSFIGTAPGAALPWIAAYMVAVLVSVVLSPLAFPAIWPGVGILASALLLLPRRSWVWVLVGSAIGYLVVMLSAGRPIYRPLALAPINLSESILLAYLVRRLFGQNLDFSDGRRLLKFLLLAAAPALSSGAIVVMALARTLPSVIAVRNAEFWLISHYLGAAMTLPFIMVFAERRRYRAAFPGGLELAAVVGALLVGQVILPMTAGPSMMFLTFPAMMLIAFRYGPIGAASAALAICVQALVFVGHGGLDRAAIGGQNTLEGKLQWLAFFQAIVCLTILPAAGALGAHARVQRQLARRTLVARAARRRADAAAAVKSEFLANMSHEIRTPLNGVIGLADALSHTDLAPAQRRMLDVVLESGKALTGLLTDALDLARSDSGALELADEAFNVRDAIGPSAFLFETIARKKGLAFQVHFDVAAPGVVKGDAMRIKQVIANLVSNAVKFTEEGSVSLDVTLAPPQDGMMTLQATVRDTGPGFGADTKARLFKRFEQGDSSITRRYGGSGLGLAIVQRLAEMMKGTVACESTPGVGSVFTFTVALPAACATDAAALTPAEEPRRPDRPLSVLLAEDHPVNRQVVAAILAGSATLTLAVNGSEALDAFRAGDFDLILMDTHMPVMDGLAAIRAIRAEERRLSRISTPIISLTADAMPQQIEDSLAAGADLHLAKPITTHALFSAIETCLAGKPEPCSAVG
ncbi:MAG TPA: ATP-binding protein [Caulobacteraceae bacterium]|jgi:signal transduction histidine kinase/ActR/RegA family two-component response regulator|nr:ATP-binding protein [Caulobacteraceae bacterium]